MKFLIDFGKLFLKVILNRLESPFLMVWEQLNDSTPLFSRGPTFFYKFCDEADIADQLEIVAHVTCLPVEPWPRWHNRLSWGPQRSTFK